MSEPDSGEVYVFGQFKANVSRCELEKSGSRIRLQEKPFRLLSTLLERPGEVVSREDLRARLWPANTFVEFDDGLNAAVKKLRLALGDSADNPRYIETIPRRGYRFICPVSKFEQKKNEANKVVAAEAPAQTQPPHPLSSRWVALGCALVLFAAVAVGVALRHRAASVVPIKSIAVLPFENLSHDDEQAFFAEGITDELITDLAKTGALRVISRTSMMHYKQTTKSIPEIARELNVDAVIEGTVSRSDHNLLVRAQLIRAVPEQHIWAESYNRATADLTSLQADLARDIAGAVRVQLRTGQLEEFARERKSSPEAHELYLKGRYFWNKRSKDGNRKAFEYFQQTVARDPNFAPGYAGLADAYAFGGAQLPIKDAAAKSREMAEKALALDGQLAEAYATLGLGAPQFDWNWNQADTYLKRAIELNPNFATAYQWHAEVYLAPMARLDEAIAEARQAERLDPLSAIIASDVGKLLFYARRYDEAEEQAKKALELDPDFAVAHDLLAAIYFYQGKYDLGREQLAFIKPHVDASSYLAKIIPFDIKSGRQREAKAEMQQLLNGKEPLDSGQIAALYTVWGDYDLAFRWLHSACQSGSAWGASLAVSPAWDSLRSDPRFADAKRCFNLP